MERRKTPIEHQMYQKRQKADVLQWVERLNEFTGIKPASYDMLTISMNVVAGEL